MKKYLLCLVLFISISLCGCNNGSDEQQIGEGTGIIEHATDRQEEPQNNDVAAEDILPNASDDMREGDLVAVGETWEEAYKSIICDIDSNLADPYNYSFGSNGDVYLGIHDFNNDDIPELVIGVYDDYNPDKGVINGNQVTGEVFRQQFNLAELTNNSRIEYSKVTEENEIILAVNVTAEDVKTLKKMR